MSFFKFFSLRSVMHYSNSPRRWSSMGSQTLGEQLPLASTETLLDLAAAPTNSTTSLQRASTSDLKYRLGAYGTSSPVMSLGDMSSSMMTSPCPAGKVSHRGKCVHPRGKTATAVALNHAIVRDQYKLGSHRQ